MNQFSAKSLLALGLLVALFSFNACQKDGFNPSSPELTPGKAADRAPITYGVTIFDPTHPSQIVGMDGAGNIISTANAFYNDPILGPVALDNLKGICLTSWGQYFITTGAPASTVLGPSIYDNALLKVDPVTGMTSYFNSVCPFGTVSDLEFDPNTQEFYGLLNNSNQIISINNGGGGNYTNYTAPVAITGIAGRTLKGLSLVRDNTGMYLVGAATRTNSIGLAAQLYTVPAGGGLATLMTDLAPLGDFAGGHSALGFNLAMNHMVINRSSAVVTNPLGLSEINPWAAPLGGTTGTAFWGLQGLDFEDIASDVY